MLPTIAVKPKTKPILAMLDPITLLRAMAGEPVRAACKLTINSGTDVANETTVIPITIFEILNLNYKTYFEDINNIDKIYEVIKSRKQPALFKN